MSDEESFGGITGEELEEYSKETSGPPGIANVSNPTRFVTKVARLVQKRKDNESDSRFTAFILVERLQLYKDACHDGHHPFVSSGDESIGDAVWLATAPLGDAQKLNIEAGNADEAFGEILESEFKSYPTVLVKWHDGTPIANYYPRGVEESGEMNPIDLSDLDISAQRMKEVIDLFHEKRLAAPQLIVKGGGSKVWNQPQKGIPVARVETSIQGRLIDSLISSFPFHEAHGEEDVAEGRADVIVWHETHDPLDDPVRKIDWLLELKALTDKTHTGNSVAKTKAKSSVQDGLGQAIRFREKLPALKAALCCFDLRANNISDSECFASISAKAVAEDIYLWRWVLYRSALDLRKALGH